MAETIKAGIIGGGWPGQAHARGYQAAGGFKVVAIADLIPQRRKQMMAEFGIEKEFASAEDLLKDESIQAVSIGLPNDLHAEFTIAALKAGKHVVCESPPAINAGQAKRMGASAEREKKVLLYAMQRRFGPAEQAARLAISRGYAGEIYHVRASWTRTRGIPMGTGWYADKSKSGGGAMIDLGLHLLDLGWNLLGQPKPVSVYAVTQQKFRELFPGEVTFDVEDQGSAILKFEGGKTIELSAAWAINQPPNQNGAICRAYGQEGAIEVYTPDGAVLYRNIGPKGDAKAVNLKPPKLTHHAAMMRHFRQCIIGSTPPEIGAVHGVSLMAMMDAIYKSAARGKSVAIGA